MILNRYAVRIRPDFRRNKNHMATLPCGIVLHLLVDLVQLCRKDFQPK